MAVLLLTENLYLSIIGFLMLAVAYRYFEDETERDGSIGLDKEHRIGYKIKKKVSDLLM